MPNLVTSSGRGTRLGHYVTRQESKTHTPIDTLIMVRPCLSLLLVLPLTTAARSRPPLNLLLRLSLSISIPPPLSLDLAACQVSLSHALALPFVLCRDVVRGVGPALV